MQIRRIVGFTIAELLITIAIIGIIAELTIPPLINEQQKQTTVTKVKEAYSLLQQITIQADYECGDNILSCISDTTKGDNDSTSRSEVTNLYKTKLLLYKDCTNGTTTSCFGNSYINLNYSANNFSDSAIWVANARMILKNNIAIAFDWNGPTYSYPNLFYVYIDINNVKPPNQYGKDMFILQYDVSQRKLIPIAGNDCSPSGNGGTCINDILTKNVINYY